MVLTKKQSLALHCALSHNSLFNQATDCGYFWKDNKRIYSVLEILKNQNEMIKSAKQKIRGRISDDKNNFVTSSIVRIVAGIPIHSIVDHMRNIDVPRSTKTKKRIKQYPKVNYELMIQIQDWILKHPNVIHLPITVDTLLIKDEFTGNYF